MMSAKRLCGLGPFRHQRTPRIHAAARDLGEAVRATGAGSGQLEVKLRIVHSRATASRLVNGEAGRELPNLNAKGTPRCHTEPLGRCGLQ